MPAALDLCDFSRPLRRGPLLARPFLPTPTLPPLVLSSRGVDFLDLLARGARGGVGDASAP